MDYIFYQVTAINGFDGVGHYLRAGLIINQCSTYAVAAGRRLLGELQHASATAASAHAAAATRAASTPTAAAHRRGAAGKAGCAASLGKATGASSARSPRRLPTPARAGARARRRAAATPAPDAGGARRGRARRRRTTLLDYLFGRRQLMRGRGSRHRRQPRADRRGDRRWSSSSPSSWPTTPTPGLPFVPDLLAQGRGAERGAAW